MIQIRYFLSRYVAYAFIALEIFLLPLLVSPHEYGNLELLKAIAVLAPYSLLGSFSGYMYSRYSEKVDHYNILFVFGFISSAVTGVVFSLFYSKFLLLIPFCLNAMSIIVEKKMQVSGHFILSILFKPLLSIMILILVSIMKLLQESFFDPLTLLSASYILSFVVWLIICKYKSSVELIVFPSRKFKDGIDKYIHLIKKGFFINVSTIILSLLLFNYRYFISSSFEKDLSGFSLAFNFAQFIFLGVNTVGYISTVEIGENLSSITQSYLKKILKKTMLIFLGLFFSGLLVAVFYDTYIRHFNNFIGYFLILSIFVGLFYAMSTITPILLYKNKINASTFFLLGIFLIDFYSSKLLINQGFSGTQILIKSGCLLILSGLYNCYLIFFQIEPENNA